MKAGMGASLVVVVCCTGVAAAQDVQNVRRFEAKDVFSLEWAADPQVSPDGGRIAYVRTAFDKLLDRPRGTLWMLAADGSSHRPLITERDASAPRWSPDGGRIAYKSKGANGPELRVRYLDDGADFAVAQLFEAPGPFAWSPNGAWLAFSMFVAGETPSFATPPPAPKDAKWAEPVRVFDDVSIRFDGRGWLRKGATHLFVVPAEGGEPRQLTTGDHDFDNPVWLNDGTLLAVGNDVPDAKLDPIESEIYAIDVASGARRALTGRDGPDRSPAVSPDRQRIAYVGYDDELRAYQPSHLYVMNADGSGSRDLTAGYDHPVSSPRFSADGRRIYATAEDAGHTTLIAVGLDGTIATLASDVGGTSVDRPYASGDFSAAASKAGVVAYTQERPDRPADVAVLRDGSGPRRLTDLSSDALGHIDLAPLEEIQVPSSYDARPIEAWVAKPPGFVADGSFPVILEIHGGPYAMYGPSFAAEIQRYAAEGYVTVYANPRGSTGYGDAFAQEIDLAYPGHDYDDLMSVVDALIERNYADPQRLFVTGGSGGGVLTAWIVGKTHRFAAAASVKPVINWATMATAGDIGPFVVRNWLRATPWEDPDLYFRLSPISLVGNVTTPTMIMVGEEDWRCPTWEAEQFYGALELRKIPTALVRVPGSSHHIAARPSHLIAKTDNIMGWFRKYDPTRKD